MLPSATARHCSVRQPSRKRSCSAGVSFQLVAWASADASCCSRSAVSNWPSSPGSVPRSSVLRSRQISQNARKRRHKASSTEFGPRSPSNSAALPTAPGFGLFSAFTAMGTRSSEYRAAFSVWNNWPAQTSLRSANFAMRNFAASSGATRKRYPTR